MREYIPGISRDSTDNNNGKCALPIELTLALPAVTHDGRYFSFRIFGLAGTRGLLPQAPRLLGQGFAKRL